ncbi:hypothetical protein CCR75_002259 [Bremia lactucae]|uniref:Uncharacterized protein n=1 Tax=Bremia lactucae TaxID=4779 RepID=A0A976IF34_BRELC|nr:hypothetical protein CCR75_002259 [Bremia lactucae]
MASGTATVKAVLSGDTLVLMGSGANTSPSCAPRLARSPEQSNEPYAWASREHLRKLCVGKVVHFKVEYRVPSINRDFGSVWLPPNARGIKESLCVIQARTGFARVKTLEQSRDGVCVDHEKMLQQEQVAMNEKKGMYADANSESNATVQWQGADTAALLEEHKGKLVPAIVEAVRDGASLRVILKPTLQLINFGLSGVQCPRLNPPLNTADAQEKTSTPSGPAPYAQEAKHFTEVRLLHRDVELKFEGVDKFGNLFGSVVHPSGRNISVELLQNGLGRMADWSSAFTSASVRATMRNAEKEAKQQKVRVWREYEAPVLQSPKHVKGVVVEVISGDCLVVYVPDTALLAAQEKRIYLSSLRAPRLGNARRNEPNAPYANEAKEYLRHRAIAKTVHIEVEYEKPSPAGQGDVMTFGSVFLEPTANAVKKNPEAKGVNLAMDIVAAGLAEVVRHRPEEEKSEYYDDLVTAETKAQTQKKHLHSNKEPPATERRVTDLCFDATKAKQFLPFLKREQSIRAVVEHVYSATRVKLYVSKENCLINFVVAGIKCPQPARHGAQGVILQPAEPLGEEAKLFTKRNVMQREVMVEIEDMDRGGNAFGPLFVVPSSGGKPVRDDQHNYGVRLLDEGLAWVDSFSVERTALGNVLQRAEERAKSQKKKYWATYEAQAKAQAAQPIKVKTKDEIIPRVKLSEIVNGTHFYFQNVGDRNCAAVEEKMKILTRTHGLSGKTFEVRRNAVCAALFDDGNGSTWNRAKVEHVASDGSARVRFLDYGNQATVTANCLRPLDADALQYPPQAKEAVFAWIKPLAATEEFGSDAAIRLGEVAWGKILSCRIHGNDDHGRMQVSLYLPDGKSVAGNLVEAGLLRTDRKALRSVLSFQKPLVEGILTAQEAVLSGDTLVLMGSGANGPPQELVLTLSSLQAPRLARSPEQSNEPYAWASREHLRKLCIGKVVHFKVEYRVPSINRDFGSVWLPPNARGIKENLCVIQARTGFARVKTLEQSRDGVCVDHEKMLQQEQVAMNEKKGLYADANSESNATVQWQGADTAALLEEHKGKLVPAIVEAVRDGASLRVILKPTLQLINFGLSGVQCPRLNPPLNTADAQEKTSTPSGPAPYAQEAKHFTEVRLLHRDVELKFEGVDKFGNLFGSVVHPSGRNISVELLQNGLGRMADWSSAFTSASVRATMRNAEKEAKQQKVRVWREYEAPVLQSPKHVKGVVVEVISGDCLVVYVPDTALLAAQEKRIYLSSLRAPRLGNARRNEPNAPYANEAKEYLRHRAIAKTVHIEVEYEKPSPTGQGDVMTFGSVFLEPTANAVKKNPEAKGVNLAMDIVAAGLAEVVRHRPEEEKSEYYDDLVTAETKAHTQKKNLHSNKEPPATERRVTDLCFDATKAKQFLPFLKREQSIRAVVEHVYSATRVKLYVSKENCLINFVVAGIKCPQPARHGAQGVILQPAEPLGEEAKLFTKRNVMQREVMVEIEDMDRGGNAFGPLFVVPSSGGKPVRDDQHNYGVRLLDEGLAWVDSFSVERTALGNVLQRAEERAKSQKKKYWATYEAQAKAQAAQPIKVKTKDEIIPRVKLSEIVNGTHFYFQNVGDRNCAAVEEKMKIFTRTHGLSGKTFEVRRNAVCAALFDDGNGSTWNRAKVEHVASDGSARVRFLDYGNQATVTANCLRPLDADALQYPPQAKEAVFAWIKPLAATEEFGSDAAIRLGEVAWGKILSCRIHGNDDHGRMQVSLYLPDGKSVAGNLVEAGLLRTDRKALRSVLSFQKPLVEGILTAQEVAKKQRRCLWQYGDIESDDEQDL